MKSVKSLIFRHYLSEVMARLVFVLMGATVLAMMVEGEEEGIIWTWTAILAAFMVVGTMGALGLGDMREELRLRARELLGLPFITPEISRDGVWGTVLFRYGQIPHEELDNDRSPAVRRAEDVERVARFFNLLPVHARFGVF